MPKASKPEKPPPEIAASTQRLAHYLLDASEDLHRRARETRKRLADIRSQHEQALTQPRTTQPVPHGGNVITIGASAGGIEAIRVVLRKLPLAFPAAVFVVLHTGSEGPSALPSVLGRTSGLPVGSAVDGAAILSGRVYVAPPDYHLLLEPGRMRLNRGPRENRQRPSIDVLFRSAARAYDSRVIAVLLSGLLDDGTAGVQAVKAYGGSVVIQDPEDAMFPSMPLNALRFVQPDSVSRAADIGPLLTHMVNGHMPRTHKLSPISTSEGAEPLVPGPYQRPMMLSCPDCNGVLQEYGEGRIVRFRCQVGHEFSPNGLVEAQDGEVERALWTAIRALEESSAVAQRLAESARLSGRKRAAQNYLDEYRLKHRDADLLRRIIYRRNGDSSAENIGNGAPAIDTPPPRQEQRKHDERNRSTKTVTRKKAASNKSQTQRSS